MEQVQDQPDQAGLQGQVDQTEIVAELVEMEVRELLQVEEPGVQARLMELAILQAPLEVQGVGVAEPMMMLAIVRAVVQWVRL